MKASDPSAVVRQVPPPDRVGLLFFRDGKQCPSWIASLGGGVDLWQPESLLPADVRYERGVDITLAVTALTFVLMRMSRIRPFCCTFSVQHGVVLVVGTSVLQRMLRLADCILNGRSHDIRHILDPNVVQKNPGFHTFFDHKGFDRETSIIERRRSHIGSPKRGLN